MANVSNSDLSSSQIQTNNSDIKTPRFNKRNNSVNISMKKQEESIISNRQSQENKENPYQNEITNPQFSFREVPKSKLDNISS